METKSITYDENLKALDNPFNFLPSPSGDFLAFMVGSGEGGRGPADAEFLDVGLIDFRDGRSTTPKMLTQHGGAFSSLEWSSTGKYLAYSDFDENGIAQILIYEVMEEKAIQLSKFGDDMLNWRILDLSWAEDDTKLAFRAYKRKEKEDANPFYEIIGVFSKTQGSLLWVSPPYLVEYHYLSWIHDTSRFLTIRIAQSGEQELIIFDGEAGAELEVLGPLRNEKKDTKRKDILRKFILPIGLGYLYETEDGIFYTDETNILND